MVGTFRRGWTFPWFDGWHVTGMIDVEEALYGRPPAKRIAYRFVCNCSCGYRPSSDFGSIPKKGIWFLRPEDA